MKSPQNRTILLLEDERPLQQAIQAKLETSGFSVVAVRSVDQALDHLKEAVKVDAIWLDHYLFGNSTGLDLVTTLKHNASWKKIPVFVVSNIVSPAELQQYLKLGVQRCYSKVDTRLDKVVADIKKILGTD